MKVLLILLGIIIACIYVISSTGGNSDSSTEINSNALIQYFSKDLGFKFDKENKNDKGEQTILGELGKPNSKQFVNIEVTHSNNKVKGVVLTVLLNGDNSVINPDLAYISKLIKKILPDTINSDEVVKQGISEAIKNNKSLINSNGRELEFMYIKNAGGVEGDNAVIFRYDTTKK